MMSNGARTEIVELAAGVYARLHDGLTNAGIIVGDDSVLVIDSLRVPSFARELRADVRRLTDKPVQYLVDTHGHWDHAFGNEEFADATIVGHVNCRRELEELGEGWRQGVIARNVEWSEEIKTVRITPPDLTFDRRLELHFGGRRIDLVYLGRAHTSGDIFINLPDDRLLFTGDVAQDGGVPYMLDGYMADWIETDTRILDLPFDRFVSGHGPIGARPALQDARDFIAALVTLSQAAHREGKDLATATESVRAALDGRFGQWRGFARLGDGVGRAYRQMTPRP
ncbi:MAG: MBL fold metallo-hydrolase [Dehalococcoidia bacterium]|nr:MAG: MBL fold metallo-hydrolase [Dehalococcoidia bacterium]